MTEAAKLEARANSFERWKAGIFSQVRWLGGSSAVGVILVMATSKTDQTGWSATITMSGAACVGVLGSFLSQWAAGLKAIGLSRAAVRKAELEAEAEPNFVALQETRKHLEWCEGETTELKARVERIEAKFEALRERHDADMKEVIDKFLRRDSPDARPRPHPR